MALSKPTIAIAGATGGLGAELTRTLLSDELKDMFAGVVLLSRKSTAQLEAWATQGATVVIYNEDGEMSELVKCLDGVDVFVNAIAFRGSSFRDKLLRALPSTQVRLYFPSEFGVDHTIHDFPHPEWDAKKAHYALAQEILPPRIKMCRLFISLFLDDGIGRWYGFDTKEGKYEGVGSVDVKISYTAIGDVARVITVLVHKDPEEVPSELRLAGSTASMREIAEMMADAGAGEIKLTSMDGQEFKKDALANSTDAVQYLRFLMGDGSIDHRPKEEGGLGNDNEVVNPGEKAFKWKQLRDVALETKGRPNVE